MRVGFFLRRGPATMACCSAYVDQRLVLAGGWQPKHKHIGRSEEQKR